MSESSKSNLKSRKTVAALVCVTVLALFVFLFRHDNNPEVTYNPVDGKAMVLELQQKLTDAEDLSAGFLPVDIHADVKVPKPLYSATIVRYDKPKFPYLVCRLMKFIHLPVEGAHLSFDLGDYAVMSTGNVRIGILSTQKEGRNLHQVSTKNFRNDAMVNDVLKETEGLKNLAPNSHLKVHSDFLMIETGGAVRVYLLDKLPANVTAIRDQVMNNPAILSPRI